MLEGLLFVFLNHDRVEMPIKNITPQTIECIYSASATYDLYPPYLLAVAEQEGGKYNSRVENSNGTYDLGYMQFNTAYIQHLAKYGITEKDVSQDNCYPYYLSAWRISNHLLNDKGSIIQKISNYHSKTPKYNEIYGNKLKVRIKVWDNWHNKNKDHIVSSFLNSQGRSETYVYKGDPKHLLNPVGIESKGGIDIGSNDVEFVSVKIEGDRRKINPNYQNHQDDMRISFKHNLGR